MKSTKDQKIICQWCGRQSYLIWVHGHAQCSFCKINVDECCRGEVCESKNGKEEIKSRDE